jgi:hypothetical protein
MAHRGGGRLLLHAVSRVVVPSYERTILASPSQRLIHDALRSQCRPVIVFTTTTVTVRVLEEDHRPPLLPCHSSVCACVAPVYRLSGPDSESPFAPRTSLLISSAALVS